MQQAEAFGPNMRKYSYIGAGVQLTLCLRVSVITLH